MQEANSFFIFKSTHMHKSKTFTKTFINLILHFFCFSSFAQQYVVSGFVENKSNGEKLINAVIYSSDKKYIALSNNYGFYSIKLPAGETEISYSYVGFYTQKQSFYLSKDTSITISLEPNAKIDEVVISASKLNKNGKIDIIPSKLREIPTIMGETDVMKALQYYPGVQSGMEGRSGLYVRGGGPDQNLILLDGVPVYNVNHLFGFFSVFNTDAISSVSLYKSNIPARYGGFLSSVLDIQMKEGNNKEWKGDFTIGLIASKLTIEGPLKKDKASVIVSARRTYVDVLLWPYYKFGNKTMGAETKLGYYFQDINIKLNYKFSEKNHLFLSMYTGKDKAYVNDKYTVTAVTNHDVNDLKWGNLTTVMRWNYVFSNKLFSNTDISYSRYKYKTSIKSIETSKPPTGVENTDIFKYSDFSGIESFAQNTRFDYFVNSTHHLQFGFGNTYFVFTPGSVNYEQNNNSDSTLNTKVEYNNDKVFTYKLRLYVSDEINFKKLKLNIGAHYSGFRLKKTYYQCIEPRIGMQYSLAEKVSLNMSFNRTAQYIHLASNYLNGLPTDLWLPVTENVKPSTSSQYTAGTAIKLKNDYRISIETYYKSMDNLLEYKEGISYFTTTSNWENTVTQGRGRAYGMELLFEKNLGKITGFIGYTLAYSKRTFSELNQGKEYPYKYDRRHDVSIVGNYKFSERINLGLVWVYGTGNSITLPIQRYAPIEELYNKYSKVQDIIEYYGNKNNYKLPAYHRLDVSINLTKQKKKGIRTWSYGVYNLYNRQNAYMVYVKEVNGENKLYQRSLFPILPYFSYNYKF